MSNAISSFVLATGLKAAVKHTDKSGLVKRLAKDLDGMADINLGGRSEPFQEELCDKILLALVDELMKDNPDGLKRLYLKRAEPFRFDGEVERRAIHEKGREVQPKHRP